jgi:hypothetical protein
MTTTTTIRGLFAAGLLLGAAAMPAFAQGTAATTPAAPANRPAATAPNSGAAGAPTAGTAAAPATRPAITMPTTPNSAAPQRSSTVAPSERQGSPVAPSTGAGSGTTGPASPAQSGGDSARTN